MSNEKCCYCGQEAKFKFKNGKYCCSDNFRRCQVYRTRMSENQKGEKNHQFKKPSWNRGLTKETDERVKKYTETQIETKNKTHPVAWNKGLTKEDDERIAKYGKTVSLSKKGVPNYKNRKPINKSRAKSIAKFRYLFKKRLYASWILPILKRDNFQCVICKKSKTKLEVYHLIRYNTIFDNCCKKLGLVLLDWEIWTESQIEELEKEIIICHKTEIGITLCLDCHYNIDEYRRQFKRKEKC